MGMTELIEREAGDLSDDWHVIRSRPTRANLAPGTTDTLVQHVGWVCAVRREELGPERIGGLVLCSCGSAGWTA